MELQYDPYEFAEALNRMSVDLASETRGVTNVEVSVALVQASRMIEELIDTLNHYRTQNRIAIVANGEEIVLEESLVEPLLGEAIRDIVTKSLEMYLTAAPVIR